jgi:hypothetical protein
MKIWAGKCLALTLEFTAKFDYAELDRRTLKVLTTEDGWYRAEFIPGDLGNNLFLAGFGYSVRILIM